MKVEIWSDVMCPFCYIGKRKFEAAMSQLNGREDIVVEWKSFQLAPEGITDPNKSINQYLAENKGWSLDYAKQMTDHVTQMAKDNGLEYNMDKAVVANSFDAHRILQLAKTHNLGDNMEEQLFKAYFTDGKNTADHTTLLELAVAAGLNAIEVQQVLNSNDFADKVRQDVYEAQQVGVRGVPFFVLDRKYAISGAQDSTIMLNALTQSLTEWKQTQPAVKLQTIEGQVCTPDGECN